MADNQIVYLREKNSLYKKSKDSKLEEKIGNFEKYSKGFGFKNRKLTTVSAHNLTNYIRNKGQEYIAQVFDILKEKDLLNDYKNEINHSTYKDMYICPNICLASTLIAVLNPVTVVAAGGVIYSTGQKIKNKSRSKKMLKELKEYQDKKLAKEIKKHHFNI